MSDLDQEFFLFIGVLLFLLSILGVSLYIVSLSIRQGD